LVIERTVRLANSSASLDRFVVHHDELGRLSRHAESAGLDVVTQYHRHTSGSPYLSRRDRQGARWVPFPWIIVALQRGPADDVLHQIRAFRAKSGEPMTVVPSEW
jgi:proteasome lid subunit RPN8/RPN11